MVAAAEYTGTEKPTIGGAGMEERQRGGRARGSTLRTRRFFSSTLPVVVLRLTA